MISKSYTAYCVWVPGEDLLWLKSCDLPHHEICRIADLTENTVRAYLNEFNEGGVEALKTLAYYRPQSELDKYQATIEEEFKQRPPASAAEAQATIARLTGIERSPTQVRKFLHRMGMNFRKVAAVPAKADPVAQETFKKNTSSLGWRKPRRAVDAFTLSIPPTSFKPPSSVGSGASVASSSAVPPVGKDSTCLEHCAPLPTA
jgi:transposase